MTNPNDTYTSPLASRNASPEMLRLWSPRHKFNTWRRVWLAVAEAQYEVTKHWGDGSSEGGPSGSEGSGEGSKPLAAARGSFGPHAGPLVTREQVEELRAVVERGITDAEIARAGELERELRHDVMAHVHCLGEQCPKAKPIIHLGCTSQDVVCNADLLIQAEALSLIGEKVDRAMQSLGAFGEAYKSVPTLGFTHYQPAQPTTVGRRAVGWAHDLWECKLNEWPKWNGEGPLRGFRGATGTQASFLALFGGDHTLVEAFEASAVFKLRAMIGWESEESIDSMFEAWRELDEYATEILLGEERFRVDGMFEDWREEEGEEDIEWSWEENPPREYIEMNTFQCVGQTYPRVRDTQTLADLASVAAVLHKIATDIRLLSNRKEIDEPFGDKQIGSSAMPYKRNPMRCERICGLSRFVMNLVGNAYDTAATQWLERTLDDSSNRRLSLSEAFLALDGALDLMHNVASGLVVHEATVRKNLMAELPFLATENILMEAVKAGGDRQDLHERIRVHAQEAGHRVKHLGLDNDLLDRLRNDSAFAAVHDRLTDDDLLDPMKYVGRAVEQTERFIAEVIDPMKDWYEDEFEAMGDSEPRV